jgi:predicted nucleic acid-binding Zn ribbon protein
MPPGTSPPEHTPCRLCGTAIRKLAKVCPECSAIQDERRARWVTGGRAIWALVSAALVPGVLAFIAHQWSNDRTRADAHAQMLLQSTQRLELLMDARAEFVRAKWRLLAPCAGDPTAIKDNDPRACGAQFWRVLDELNSTMTRTSYAVTTIPIGPLTHEVLAELKTAYWSSCPDKACGLLDGLRRLLLAESLPGKTFNSEAAKLFDAFDRDYANVAFCYLQHDMNVMRLAAMKGNLEGFRNRDGGSTMLDIWKARVESSSCEQVVKTHQLGHKCPLHPNGMAVTAAR